MEQKPDEEGRPHLKHLIVQGRTQSTTELCIFAGEREMSSINCRDKQGS